MQKLVIFLAICGAFAFAAPAAHAADGTINGTITYASNGSPMANAYVYIINANTNTTTGAVAGTDGTYTATVAPGKYDVSVSNIYANYSIVLIKKTTTVTVGSGEAKTGVNIATSRRGWFTGHVYKADGVTVVSDAIVTFSNVAGDTYGRVWSAQTSSIGVYTGTPTPDDETTSAIGTYTVTISRPGYFSYQTTGVQLNADDAATSQDFRLTQGGSVSGTIIDSSGAAVANALVTAYKMVGGTRSNGYSATTNASGAYVITIADSYPYNNTAAGDYSMTVNGSGYVTKSSRFTISADTTAITGKDFSLNAGKVFSGTITSNATNAALPGAIVSLYKRTVLRSTVADFSATTGSDGTFSINTLPAGKYRLMITKTGYATVVTEYITITANKTGNKYKLEPGATISGQVYTGKNTGIDGAYIEFYPLNNAKTAAYLSTTADENGAYSLSGLKKGTYKMVVTSTDYVEQVATVTVKNSNTITKNVKLIAAGSVSGYVTDKTTGLPISGYPGMVVVKVVGTTITTSPDTNGFFTLDGIKPGTQKITAISGLFETPAQVTVKVSAGKTKTGVNFSLTPRQ